MSLPTTAYVVDFWIKANESWEYDDEYQPDWYDGYATYHNQDKGDLWDHMAAYPAEWADDVLVEYVKRYPERDSYIREMVDMLDRSERNQ